MLAAGELLPRESIAADESELDAILDRRDQDGDFSTQWMEHYEKVAAMWNQAPKLAGLKRIIEEIREMAFVNVSNATEQHEMASSVSDDFELIAGAIAVGYDSDWVSGLLRAYRRGQIPQPALEPASGTLHDILNTRTG
jgi:hypothetical protein